MFRKNKKKGNDNGKKQTEGTTLRKNLNMSDSSLVKKEIKLLENKVAVMRRKIDEQHQKNSSVKK